MLRVNWTWTVSTGDDEIDLISSPSIAEYRIGEFDDPIGWYVSTARHRESVLMTETWYNRCTVTLFLRWIVTDLEVVQRLPAYHLTVLPQFESHVLVVRFSLIEREDLKK